MRESKRAGVISRPSNEALLGFRALADALPEAMLLVSGKRVVRACNLPAQRLFGRAREALVGEPLPVLFDDPSERITRWFAMCSSTTGFIPTRLLVRAGGRRLVLAEGASLECAGEERSVIVRVRSEGTMLHRFAEMNRRLDALAEEVARRTHTEHALLRTQLELWEANAELARLAEYDALTSIPNRRGFDRALAFALHEAREREAGLAVVLFDVDHFKRFNDSAGHLSGDRCLTSVASILKGVFRREDDVARFGGEEFAAILTGLTLEEARSTALRALEAVRRAALVHPSSPDGGIVTISAGLAYVEGGTFDGDALLQLADEALYDAKAGGRDRLCIKTA